MGTFAFSFRSTAMARCTGEASLHFAARAAEARLTDLSVPFIGLADGSTFYGSLTEPWYQSAFESHAESSAARAQAAQCVQPTLSLIAFPGFGIGYKGTWQIGSGSGLRM